MKNINSLIIVLLITFSCLASISYALPSIEITETNIEENIFVGDVLDVAIDFAIGSDRSELVRLSLYIDNKIKDSYTSFYPDGDFTFTFHYDTDYISRGEHTLKIKAEVIRDDDVKDSDSQSQTFELKQVTSDIYHNVVISQIKYPLKASMNSNIPITLTIQNNGVVDESSMQTKIKINAKTYKSDYFYLKKGDKKIQTMYVKTPMEKGEFEIETETSNPYVMDKKTIDLVVEDISLLLKTDSTNISQGKYIFVYGYVREETPRQNYVYIYKDNVYFTKIIPGGDGFFSYFLKFEEEGEHIISAKIYGMKKSIKINVYAPAHEQEIIENKTTLIPGRAENKTGKENATAPVSVDISNETQIGEEEQIGEGNGIPDRAETISGYFVKISETNILPLIVLFAIILLLSYIALGNHRIKAIPWNSFKLSKQREEGEPGPGKSLFSGIEGRKAAEGHEPAKPLVQKEEPADIFTSSYWVSYRNMVK
ncbi:MAG: hypothetical protein DRN66_00090 [Candidatus Nanohalarchaeota archaeon]|nr:MAG: hypothetical protein DRN66_00090 [Candidatus Nanohaloarchaeota archaeon]